MPNIDRPCITHHYCDCTGARMHHLEAMVQDLRMLHHEIYEIYAGAESCDDNTRVQYLLRLIHQMKDLAAEGKKMTVEINNVPDST